MNRILILVAAFGITALLNPLAYAGDREERRAEILAQFDADGDGQLNAEERQAARESGQFQGRGGNHEARRAQILEEFDADGDGQLNEAERQAARDAGVGRRGGKHGERRARMLEQFDLDGDGQLSDSELEQAKESGAFEGRRGRGRHGQ